MMDEEIMNNEFLVDERRSSRRRGGYERDRSYVGMTSSDEVRAEMLSSSEEGNPQSRRYFLVMGKSGFPLHGFNTRDDAETFVRDNADAAEIVGIPST